MMLTLTGIAKRFGATLALDGVDLAVRPGECTRCSARTARARAR